MRKTVKAVFVFIFLYMCLLHSACTHYHTCNAIDIFIFIKYVSGNAIDSGANAKQQKQCQHLPQTNAQRRRCMLECDKLTTVHIAAAPDILAFQRR